MQTVPCKNIKLVLSSVDPFLLLHPHWTQTSKYDMHESPRERCQKEVSISTEILLTKILKNSKMNFTNEFGLRRVVFQQ
jgi:hypothetical protein